MFKNNLALYNKSSEGKNSNKRPVYFTIIPLYGGLTDQLMQFDNMYRLGLSLNYKYIHTPFSSRRSKTYNRFVNNPKIDKRIKRLPALVKNSLSFFGYEGVFEVFDFLGFNQYFEKKYPRINFHDQKKVKVILAGNTLTDNNIKSFEGLQLFVKTLVQLQPNPDNKTILVRFSLKPKRINLYALIQGNISNSTSINNSFQLRTAYFREREKMPIKSSFQQAELKILVHIRQGDISLLETPWNTYMSVRIAREDCFKEYDDLSELNLDNIFQVADYYKFIKGLTARFKDDDYSILIFSDGYGRAFKILNSNKEKLNPYNPKMQSFLKAGKQYEKKQFEIIDKLKNCESVIGETSKKLCDLIHSIFCANIIITSTQQRMLPQFVAKYCAAGKPLVLILYKGEIPDYGFITPAHKDYFVFVDLHNPDYEGIISKINTSLLFR